MMIDVEELVEIELLSICEKFCKKLCVGEFDYCKVEIIVEDSFFFFFEMFILQGVEEVGVNLKDMMLGFFGKCEQCEVMIEEVCEIFV